MDLIEVISSEAANAQKSDQEVLDWLKEPVDVLGPVSHNTLIKWLVAGNKLKKLEDFKASTDPTVQSLAYAALAIIGAGGGLDLSDPDAQSQLSAMVTANMFTQDDIGALNALGTRQIERYLNEGIPKPRLGHVVEARRG